MTKRTDVKRCDLSVEEWADRQTFTTTEQIHIPDLMADRVIGQEDAVEVMRKAASQKRHVMLIGEPGTGKSMLANSMVEYLPKEELQDIVAYHNPEDFNEPRIRVFPAGKGKAVVAEQKAMAAQQKTQKNTIYIYACLGLIILGLLAGMLMNNFTITLFAILGAMLIFFMFRTPGAPRNDVAIVPKVLVGHDAGEMPPFVDATGTHAGALLGDVRHDPFQSGGLETPSHDRLEAGAIHKANKGVLYIDEINLLRMESQQALLTAMQEKKMSITGQSERSSGALVKSEPVPCDFILVCAGNMDAIQGMHPALRSRIRGYGYEVYMRSTMPDTDENRDNITRFVAQEVRKDGKIPHFDKFAVAEILREAQRRSGRKGELTLRMRELGGLIRVSGDMAVQRGAKTVTADDVIMARGTARSLEQQIADRYIEANEAYKMFRTSGEAVGMVNGLAALNASSNMAEYSGIVLPIVAEVSPSQVKRAGHIVATGQLGTIAKEAVENISAVIKKYTMTNLSDSDIHLQYIGTYDGVEGDSASITMCRGGLRVHHHGDRNYLRPGEHPHPPGPGHDRLPERQGKGPARGRGHSQAGGRSGLRNQDGPDPGGQRQGRHDREQVLQDHGDLHRGDPPRRVRVRLRASTRTGCPPRRDSNRRSSTTTTSRRSLPRCLRSPLWRSPSRRSPPCRSRSTSRTPRRCPPPSKPFKTGSAPSSSLFYT